MSSASGAPIWRDPTPEDIEALYLDLDKILARCTRQQKKWLQALPKYGVREWKCAAALGIGDASVQEWRRKPHILRAISLTAEIAACEVGLNKYALLRESKSIATADISEFLMPDGSVKPPSEWPDDMRGAVSEYTEDNLGNGRIRRRIKLHPKQPSIDGLAKILGLVRDRVELTGKDGGAIETKDVDRLTDEQLEAVLRRRLAPEQRGDSSSPAQSQEG